MSTEQSIYDHLTEIGRNNQEVDSIGPDEATAVYLRTISQTKLLSATEVLVLGRKIKEGQGALLFFLNSSQTKLNLNLAGLAYEGFRAQEHLVESNTRMVATISRKYIGRGLPFSDLLQEGNLGLIEAAVRFDPERKNRFSTMAYPWIRKAISRAVLEKSRIIHVPVHKLEELTNVQKLLIRLTHDLERDPTIEELAFELEKEPSKILQLYRDTRHALSIETEEESDEFTTAVADNLPDPSADQTERIHAHVDLSSLGSDLEKILTPFELRIFQTRYFSNPDTLLSITAVAEMLGAGRKRVKEAHEVGLRKLQREDLKRKYEGYFA